MEKQSTTEEKGGVYPYISSLEEVSVDITERRIYSCFVRVSLPCIDGLAACCSSAWSVADRNNGFVKKRPLTKKERAN